jgi:hypothetical protein
MMIVAGTKIERRHMVFDLSDDVFFGRKGKGNDEGVEARNAIFKKEAVKLSLLYILLPFTFRYYHLI